MGNPKLKWTHEEEQALRAGVAKHGRGKWKVIVVDPEFKSVFANRSNVDLKDKWRNIRVFPKDTLNLPKEGTDSSSAAFPDAKSSASANFSRQHIISGQDERRDVRCCSKDILNLPKEGADSSARLPDAKISASASVSRQDVAAGRTACPLGKTNTELIFEALSSLNDEDGSDLDAILNDIQQGHELPQTFRKSLRSQLSRLVTKGRLEKYWQTPSESTCYPRWLLSFKCKLQSVSSDAVDFDQLLTFFHDLYLGVQNRYKMINGVVPKMEVPNVKEAKEVNVRIKRDEARTSDAKQEIASDLKQKGDQLFSVPGPLEEPASKAAAEIAFAENASYDAADAVHAAELFSKRLEEAESTLQWASEIHGRCAKGEAVCLG